jgi:hypothetical protein
MKTASKLALAAALAAAVPTLGSASPCNDAHHAAPVVTYPQHESRGIRHDGWREREQLRFERARLEEQRNEFYARWGRSPGKVRKFERWYAGERAELERRREELNARRYFAER